MENLRTQGSPQADSHGLGRQQAGQPVHRRGRRCGQALQRHRDGGTWRWTFFSVALGRV